MTASNVVALRPPDNPPPGPEWKPIPGAGYYEASHRGKIRSVDRKIDGKSHKGIPLKTRLQNRTRDSDVVYKLGDVRRDDGSKWTTTVQRFVLLAHAGEPGPGEECCHGPGGPLDNRYPENIRWGTRPENLADMAANRPPPQPKPPKMCPRCQAEHTGPGRRCPECVAAIGVAAAALLAETPDPDRVAEALDYPSPGGVVKLAVKHGGLRMYVDRGAITAGEPGIRHAESPEPWLRTVIKRAKAWLADSDGE